MPKRTTQKAKEVSNEDFEFVEKWSEAVTANDSVYYQEIVSQSGKKIPTIHFNIKDLEDQNKLDIISMLTNRPKESMMVIAQELKNAGTPIEDVFMVVTGDSPLLEKSMKNIRQFRSEDIGKMVVFKGLVRNSTGVLPKLKIAALECNDCNKITEVVQNDDVPTYGGARCDFCQGEDLTLRDDKSLPVDFMKCEIEEDPEGLRGRQPERISCEITGPLTDEKFRIGVGDRVTVIGIYRARKKDKTTLVQTPYIEVLGVSKRGKTYDEYKITDEEKAKFEEMSKDKNLLMKMAMTVSPNISGHNVEKSAMVLQMFGGNQFSKERRGDIHILLIGDPGVGKSRMVRYIMECAPHVVKASGAPTTTVGLTACVRKDEESAGGFVLEAGAAVLADGGMLIVDEFDKMDKEVRGALHEIMEDQVCTVSKANINATLQTRCSVLAIMNPKKNRFNDEEVVADQIDLPPSMLSRFDLIFALRDKVDENRDRDICEAILRSRQGTEVATEYEREDVTKYIMYAKSKIHDIAFSNDAIKILTDKYIQVRNANPDGIAITSRQMEGLSRIAEACAKSRLSSVVEKEDAEIAVSLLDYYLRTMCTDKDGNIEVDKINGVETSREREDRFGLLEYVQDHLEELSKGHTAGYVLPDELKFKYMAERKIDEKEYTKLYNQLVNDNKIVSKEGGRYITLVTQRKYGGF